ncbi:MAG: DMT family transporter [Rhodobacterales bacterium]|nr:DMT family transporter [Rhodobacterales bacterium]
MTALSIRNPTLFGAVNALVGVFAFSINDMIIKGLSGGYALHQIMLLRSGFAILLLVAILVPLSGGFATLRTGRPGLHALRGLLVVLSNFFFFMGLASLPLAEATAIFFVCPLISAAMSVVFLGETVGPRRWASVAVGLVGVIIIVQPGTEAFQPASLFPLAAAVTYAGMQNMTRRLGITESATSLAFYVQAAFFFTSVASGLAFGSGQFADQSNASLAFLFRGWIWPEPQVWLIFLFVGLSSAAGGYFTARAYRSTDVALVASFEYVSLPMALCWGLLFFQEWPGPLDLLGMALILASGLFLVWRESQTRLK